jgi:hypothetical protein
VEVKERAMAFASVGEPGTREDVAAKQERPSALALLNL